MTGKSKGKELDGFDGVATFKCADFSECEEAAVGITKTELLADLIMKAQLFQIKLTSVAAKGMEEGRECDCGERGKQVFGGEEQGYPRCVIHAFQV